MMEGFGQKVKWVKAADLSLPCQRLAPEKLITGLKIEAKATMLVSICLISIRSYSIQAATQLKCLLLFKAGTVSYEI